MANLVTIKTSQEEAHYLATHVDSIKSRSGANVHIEPGALGKVIIEGTDQQVRAAKEIAYKLLDEHQSAPPTHPGATRGHYQDAPRGRVRGGVGRGDGGYYGPPGDDGASASGGGRGYYRDPTSRPAARYPQQPQHPPRSNDSNTSDRGYGGPHRSYPSDRRLPPSYSHPPSSSRRIDPHHSGHHQIYKVVNTGMLVSMDSPEDTTILLQPYKGISYFHLADKNLFSAVPASKEIDSAMNKLSLQPLPTAAHQQRVLQEVMHKFTECMKQLEGSQMKTRIVFRVGKCVFHHPTDDIPNRPIPLGQLYALCEPAENNQRRFNVRHTFETLVRDEGYMTNLKKCLQGIQPTVRDDVVMSLVLGAERDTFSVTLKKVNQPTGAPFELEKTEKVKNKVFVCDVLSFKGGHDLRMALETIEQVVDDPNSPTAMHKKLLDEFVDKLGADRNGFVLVPLGEKFQIASARYRHREDYLLPPGKGAPAVRVQIKTITQQEAGNTSNRTEVSFNSLQWKAILSGAKGLQKTEGILQDWSATWAELLQLTSGTSSGEVVINK